MRAYKAGELSLPQVIDAAVKVMEDGHRAAMGAGSKDAAGDYQDTPVTDAADLASAAASEAEGQRSYLTGFVQDVIAGLSAARMSQRLGLFAATLRRAYNGSYGNTVMTAHPDYLIRWELGDNRDHCGPCVARDGKTFTLKTLPGWPGDGGFGPSDGVLGQPSICLGGPNCHCSVSFEQGGQTLATGTNTHLPGATDYYAQQLATITAARQQAEAARDAFTASLPAGAGTRAMTRDQLRRQLADLANQRIRDSGGYHGVSVEPKDIPAQWSRRRGKCC